MFADTVAPRLFGLPPGADFGTEVVHGLLARMQDRPPEALARVTLYVNTRRMQRRIREVFDTGPDRLLPRIRLVTDLALDPVAGELPPPVSPLRRRLELSQLVLRLIEVTPDLAPRSAVYDLSDSLARLMDEMQGEGVTPGILASLDVSDQSGHWSRALSVLALVGRYFGPDAAAPDREARQRAVIESLVQRWQTAPPPGPVLLAGSTGSRGATALLMTAIARLPQGGVILPGFDFDLPQGVWDRLDDPLTGEDHPQYRFRVVMDRLGLTAADVGHWTAAAVPSPARGRLISLSLRPAPVTDQWHEDGPSLGDLGPAVAGLTLLEAPSPRIEAAAIALRLRHAVDQGITAALITPDRGLTRQVAAALDRWNIVPDDSAGVPLPLSPPGRFLRQVAALGGVRATAEPILSLLRHPLCNAGTDRGDHLRRTSELDLHLRRRGPAFPGAVDLAHWAQRTGGTDPGRLAWADWVGRTLEPLATIGTLPLAHHVAAHVAVAERLAAGPDADGPDADGTGGLWDQAAGRAARAHVDDLRRHADAGGTMGARDYAALFDGVLQGGVVRDRDRGHPQILIWGTLEARVQGADLTILAGLNEGAWPEAPAPDPWLNRTMRQAAGLLLPDRRIGLSAHDYTQAVAGAEVWITRSRRSEDAETVPSRWLNRLTNLLAGLPDQGGPLALAGMRDRAAPWLAAALAQSDAARIPAAPRPSPRPPVQARPVQLSVTAIARLIRDPYAIYAERVLRLKPLDPLTQSPDAPLRGTVLHKVFERFVTDAIDPGSPEARAALMGVAAQVLADECPWPAPRLMWLSRIDAAADWFIATEVTRRAVATPLRTEAWGAAHMPDVPFTLTAKADRIDVGGGGAMIYDYKSGDPPSAKAQKAFDKQLLLEAALVAQGGFADVPTRDVMGAAYIGIRPQKSVHAPLDEVTPAIVWAELRDLMLRWRVPSRGYTARLYPPLMTYPSAYDHLSRFGEWDHSTPAQPVDLT